MTLLHTLPENHPARNKTLAEVGAECRNKHSTLWRSVVRWKIGKRSYNQLGPVWTDWTEFRIP